jgi:hypothetical protein
MSRHFCGGFFIDDAPGMTRNAVIGAIPIAVVAFG